MLAALATAGSAAATNGGLTPVDPVSPNAHHTVTAYWVIVGFTGAIFFLVNGLLITFIWKYRGRGRARTVEGPQVHGQTRLEIIWTVIPVVILVAIATVVFILLPKIDAAPASAADTANTLHITVEGHQYYWQFDYPDGTRSINTLYVPAGAVVDLKVLSSDVIHSWWIPALGGKIQAIPGRANHTWFMAEKVGTYEGQCAELCGMYHSEMLANVVVYPGSGSLPAGIPALGQQEFEGVCATCHGNLGQGGYGPNIASNPTIIQRSGLANVIRNGVVGSIGAMPPVAKWWNKAQVTALEAYLKQHVYSATPVGATP